MTKVFLFDLSNTILFAKDKNYVGGLNGLNNQLKKDNPSYNFYDFFELDQTTLDFLKGLKNKYQIALFTSETIQNEPAIKDILDAIFSPIISGIDIGFPKTDAKAYQKVAQILGVSPDEIIFYDDYPANIAAARQAGMNAHIYSASLDLKASIEKEVAG